MRPFPADLDVNLLLPLHALLEEQDLARAARRANLSAPALRSSFRRLRQHFDDDLVVATPGGFELTPLGEELRPLASDAVEAAESLLGAARPFDPAESTKTFTIGVSEYAVTVLAEPLRRVFRARAPRCAITFDSIPIDRGRLERYLMNRDLLVGPANFALPGIGAPLFRDRIVCLVDAGNPRIREGRLRLEDLAAMSHAVAEYGPEGGSSRPIDASFAAAGLQDRHVQIRVSNLLTLPFLVSGTDLCAFVPSRLIAACPPGLGLRVVETELAPAFVVESMHWHPARAEDTAGRWLRDILQTIAADLDWSSGS